MVGKWFTLQRRQGLSKQTFGKMDNTSRRIIYRSNLPFIHAVYPHCSAARGCCRQVSKHLSSKGSLHTTSHLVSKTKQFYFLNFSCTVLSEFSERFIQHSLLNLILKKNKEIIKKRQQKQHTNTTRLN